MKLTPKRWIGSLLATGAAFGVLDAAWLGVVAKDKYAESFGSLMANPINVPAAAIFYAIYTTGLTYFATTKGVASRSVKTAAIQGGAIGFLAYSTYDLTSLAVIEDFPADVVAADIAWGTFASATAAAVATAVARPRGEQD